MKTVLIPLDERPCNYLFPQMLAGTNKNIALEIPDIKLLGKKKQPADLKGLEEFLITKTKDCDNLVISLDMLLYGGLIPSRIHQHPIDELEQRLQVLKEIKENNPQIKIYAFQCIMRCPGYDSSEEEPDYYASFGWRIFRKKYLADKKQRHKLEAEDLDDIVIPSAILEDYEGRRTINCQLNLKTLGLLKAGIIDFLVIPQDDSAEYGYTAIDQKKVLAEIKRSNLQFKSMIYPGADEVAMSLLTRAYNNYYGQAPKIYPFYASVMGPTLVPKYEDRPMFESLKSHIRVTGAQLVNNPQEADLILAINSPGKIMQEAFDQPKDISYASYRDLFTFAEDIAQYICRGFKVALCDSAYSNGGDLELIAILDHFKLLDKLVAYAGWNTNCNTLGTVLALSQITEDIPVLNIIYRLLEDAFYQAKIRRVMVEKDLVELGLDYYDFKDKKTEVASRISTYLLEAYEKTYLADLYPIARIDVFLPWERMFEVGMKIHWRKQ